MSPFSGVVLGAAAVLSAPALWNSLVTGAIPVADGLLRYIVTVVVCWIGLSVVVAMVGPPPRPGGGTPTGTDTAGSGSGGGATRP